MDEDDDEHHAELEEEKGCNSRGKQTQGNAGACGGGGMDVRLGDKSLPTSLLFVSGLRQMGDDQRAGQARSEFHVEY